MWQAISFEPLFFDCKRAQKHKHGIMTGAKGDNFGEGQVPIFAKTVIQDERKDRFDAECGIRIRINAVQVIKAIAIGKGR